jgi:hypothetical protein
MTRDERLEAVAEALRDAEWAWSISPSRPAWDSEQWARMRAEVVLKTLEELKS